MAFTPEEVERRRRAYHACDSDAAAARFLGVSNLSFNRWRRKEGLPVKRNTGRKISVFEDHRRREAFRSSGSDGEAARRLGLDVGTFAAWRRSRDLPARRRATVESVRLAAAEGERRRGAYEATGSDKEAAASLGLKTITFAMWRKRSGLPAKYDRRLPSPEEARRVAVHAAATSDEDAACALGIGRKSFETWRKSRGLPPKGAHARELDPVEEARRISAWVEGPDDEHAARRTGVKPEAFRKWRNNRALPGPERIARDPATRARLAALPEGTRRAWMLANAPAYTMRTRAAPSSADVRPFADASVASVPGGESEAREDIDILDVRF